MKAIILICLLLTGPLLAQPVPGLGTASFSLRVKDIRQSLDFYHKLGFSQIAGDPAEKWVILRNEGNGCIIGIFQEQFAERFILTFNPKDVRTLEKELKSRGLTFETSAAPGSGPTHAVLRDPDGNQILLDQH